MKEIKSIASARMKEMKSIEHKPSRSEVDPCAATLLKDIHRGKTILRLKKGATAFCQGDRALAIYFIQAGKVQITIESAAGRQAVLKKLGPGEFFGEGSLAGQTLCLNTATSTQPTLLFRIESQAMRG